MHNHQENGNMFVIVIFSYLFMLINIKVRAGTVLEYYYDAGSASAKMMGLRAASASAPQQLWLIFCVLKTKPKNKYFSFLQRSTLGK
jgi:hypothetical protein